MKKKRLFTLTIAVLTSGITQATNYPAGPITFNGSLSDTTCNVILNGTAGNTVTLPPVPTSAFTGLNTEAGLTHFNLSLDCGGLYAQQLIFDGTADSNQPDSFANNATNTPAADLSVRLKSDAGYTISPGTSAGGMGTGLMFLNAQYVQTTAVTPKEGNVSVLAAMILVY